jgi:probable FeS assembly SUF system protein SufT
MRENTEFTLSRDCEAIQIPSGEKLTLKAGTQGVITQSLGGSYTIATPAGLSRITGSDADALGIEVAKPAAPLPEGEQLDEKAVWDQLKTCYDPEIPVNIVDLGLVYDCTITPEDSGAKVNVKMTLTAPGCGMGGVIAGDAEQKIREVPGVTDVTVEVVWDPVWNQSMMSDAARLQLGLM